MRASPLPNNRERLPGGDRADKRVYVKEGRWWWRGKSEQKEGWDGGFQPWQRWGGSPLLAESLGGALAEVGGAVPRPTPPRTNCVSLPSLHSLDLCFPSWLVQRQRPGPCLLMERQCGRELRMSEELGQLGL